MSSPEEIIEELGNIYDDAVADLTLEEAIEVAEGFGSYIEAALAGLREDDKEKGEG